MACGKPIIASLTGEGAKCILESGSGFVAESENEIKLSEKIIEFFELDNFKKNEMGLNGRKYFMKEFEINKLINKLIKIISNDK